MAKFTKLNIGEAVASGGGRVWKKLSSMLQLSAPTLSLSGSKLTITDESKLATSFDILADGEVKYTYAKYLYNGVELPPIPNLQGYPYCWIRKNTTSGYYDLLYSDIPFYKYETGIKDIKNNGQILRLVIKENITQTEIIKDNNLDYTFREEDFPGCGMTSAYFVDGRFYRMPIYYFDFKEQDRKVDFMC